MARHSTKVRVRSREAPMVDAICSSRGALYEVLVRLVGVASQQLCAAGAFPG